MNTCQQGHENGDGAERWPIITETRDPRRKRRLTAGILIVLTCAAVTPLTVGAWARRALTNTDRWVSIVSPLINEPAVQAALSTELTDVISSAVDIRRVIAKALPQRAAILTAPIATGVKDFIDDRIRTRLDNESVARTWVVVNRVAHEQIVDLLRKRSTDDLAASDEVKLNLLPFIDIAIGALEKRVPGLFDREINFLSTAELQEMVPAATVARVEQALDTNLSEDFGQVVVYRTNALTTAQEALALAERFMLGLLGASLVLAVASLVISIDRRRTLSQLGLGIFIGLLIVRRLALRLEDDIVATIPVRITAAGRDIVDAFLRDLRDFTTPLFVFAAVVAIGAFLWGQRDEIVGVRWPAYSEVTRTATLDRLDPTT